MSAGAVDELWADLIGEPVERRPASTPANGANSANRKDSSGAALHSGTCEGLRIFANPAAVTTAIGLDSQGFAAVRNLAGEPRGQQPCGFSQYSQDSQGCYETTHCEAPALNLAGVAWTDADIARFLNRRAKLIRWDWSEAEAEKLAERLVLRDREEDEWISCVDCRHCRAGMCSNHKAAGVGKDLGRQLVEMLQRCPGFES